MKRLLIKLLPGIICLLLCACSARSIPTDTGLTDTSRPDTAHNDITSQNTSLTNAASPDASLQDASSSSGGVHSPGSEQAQTGGSHLSPQFQSPAPQQNPFTFTRENFPRLNGSTSTVPLAEAICSVLLGERRDEVSNLVEFSKTTSAYYSLIHGQADLIIVGEDNADILAEKAAYSFEWEREPFATDAFVFVVNEANPVSSITIDEAKRIYTGEITNWRQLGGENREIIAFQRNSDAGSQNLMEKLVMQGTPMKEALTGFVPSTMGQLIEVIRNYDDSPGAIGYTVYYYAEEMNMARGLKILAIDGIEPNPQTIRSGEYPLLNPKYVVIPADAPRNAPNRILFNWLLSNEGQRLVAHEGYVSIIEAAESPSGELSHGTEIICVSILRITSMTTMNSFTCLLLSGLK